jgi:hypothetical protein
MAYSDVPPISAGVSRTALDDAPVPKQHLAAPPGERVDRAAPGRDRRWLALAAMSAAVVTAAAG